VDTINLKFQQIAIDAIPQVRGCNRKAQLKQNNLINLLRIFKQKNSPLEQERGQYYFSWPPCHMTALKRLATSHAIPPQTGKVRIQAATTSPTTPHRTAESLFEAPTPIMAVLMVCVVLRGMPKREASSIQQAAAVSAEKPLGGSSLTIRSPIVRIMRQPPMEVPTPIIRLQTRITSQETWN
jgi:hypothetical protein